MPLDERDEKIGADRQEPIGAPVVRGDPEVTGAHAESAEDFNPDDPDSLAEAEAIVQEFSEGMHDGELDNLSMLRGAAACAALVRGEGSYKAAAGRSGVNVRFLRKWARVHDLPISIRRNIARGAIAPTAAEQIARLSGDTRFILAWAVIDNDLSVDSVRQIASEILDGKSIESALSDRGIALGEISVRFPSSSYRELRRAASLTNQDVDEIVAAAVDAWLERLDY